MSKAPVRREATTTYDLRLPTTGSDRGQSYDFTTIVRAVTHYDRFTTGLQ